MDDGGDAAISNDGAGNVVDSSRLRPSAAARRFRNCEVDAADVDFSDRISAKRKSYRVSSRRLNTHHGYHQHGHHDGGDGDEDDDEDDGCVEDESPTQRLARLRREVDELRAQFSQKPEQGGGVEAGAGEGAGGDGDDGGSERRGVDELAHALAELTAGGPRAQERLARRMAASLGAVGSVTRPAPSQVGPPSIRRVSRGASGRVSRGASARARCS